MTAAAEAQRNRDVVRAFVTLGAFFAVATLAGYLYTLSWVAPIPRDGSTLVVGRDFLNVWMFGRAAALPDPGRWYDAALYQRALAELLGPGYPGQNWSYPPTIMLAAAPFGQFGYLPALLAWTLLGLAIMAATTMRCLAEPGSRLAVLMSPAAVFCLISGQSSLITAAMLVGIFAVLDRRPLLAGMLIGLLTLKPQLGVLFPVMLIASGRWRVFVAASITALALAAASVALFGIDAWRDFIVTGLPVQNIVLSDPQRIATPYYPTVFMNLRGIDLPYGAAMAAQFVVTLAAVAVVIWAFRCRRDAEPQRLAALFLAASIAAVPYLLSYDTLALAVVTVLLLSAGAFDARGRWLARLVYWLPLLQIGLGTLHVPGPALIAPLFAAYVALQLRRAGDDNRPAAPVAALAA